MLPFEKPTEVTVKKSRLGANFNSRPHARTTLSIENSRSNNYQYFFS